MSRFVRYSIKIALTATSVMGLLLGAAIIAYRAFFFVHESDVARQIQPIFGRVTFERFENDCIGFTARIALNDQAWIRSTDFDSTREKLARAEAFRGKMSDYYRIRPMEGEYLAFQNASLDVISHELRGLDGMTDDLSDYVGFAIDCWQAHDRKHQSETRATFLRALNEEQLTILTIGTRSPRFLVALIEKDNAFVFGPSF